MATYDMNDIDYTEIQDSDYITPDTINSNLYDAYSYIQALYDSTHYKAGDTITYGRFMTVGFITSSSKLLYFSIPLAHPVAASNVTVSGLFRVRQDGNYLVGTGSSHESMTASSVMLNGGHDVINCQFKTSGNNGTVSNGTEPVVNNDTAGIDIQSLTIRFS